MALKFLWADKVQLISAIGIVILLAGCNSIEGVVNPLSLTGKAFLQFYFVAGLSAILVAIALQSWLFRKNCMSQSPKKLDLYESACLVGEIRLADTAIVSLIQKGYLEIEEDEEEHKGKYRILKLKVLKDADEACHPIESAMLAGIPESQGLRQIQGVIENLSIKTQEQLQAQKLLMNPELLRSVRLYPALLIAIVLSVGGVRIAIGLSHDRPVGYLVSLCLLLAIFGWFSIWQAPERRWRSPVGDRRLEALRNDNRSLSEGNSSPENLAYGFALFGSAVLVGDEFGDLRSILTPVILPGIGSIGDGGCGAYGGDFSGGDGGGCGGGGCGGCGG
ncbi:MAG: TIGR04222 domain-containing membrane protein [Alkalinema sp. RU_4_3]|nr:TIGR04222 domain-containing membrane protein [Alkalinema sp. RU_4_3]